MFTEKDLAKLRSEISLCSLFISDYENSFGVLPNKVCDFFDGYADYLSELMLQDGFGDELFFDKLDKYDTEDNLYDWYMCFDDEPLPIDEVYQYMIENNIPYSQYQKFKQNCELLRA